MNKFKHKPTFVDAFCWDGNSNTLVSNVNQMELKSFKRYPNGLLKVFTDNGTLTCAVGDYIIRADSCKYYCCKADTFLKNYSETF